MMEFTLNMGDVMTSRRAATYTCIGLGSCIGLFLQDRVTGLSGGAHILLPESDEGPGVEGEAKFYNATGALNELLRQFRLLGSNLETLRAKVVGGANVVSANINTGERNAESVVNQLVANRVFIAAIDVGGNYFRTARFQSQTGELSIKRSPINEFAITNQIF